MKLNFIPTLIAIAVSVLIAYSFYSFHSSDNKMILTIGSFIFFATTLIMTLGTTYELPRTASNIRMLSAVFFIIGLSTNLLFSFLVFSQPSYIITNGLILLIYILIAYSIYKAKQ